MSDTDPALLRRLANEPDIAARVSRLTDAREAATTAHRLAVDALALRTRDLGLLVVDEIVEAVRHLDDRPALPPPPSTLDAEPFGEALRSWARASERAVIAASPAGHTAATKRMIASWLRRGAALTGRAGALVALAAPVGMIVAASGIAVAEAFAGVLGAGAGAASMETGAYALERSAVRGETSARADLIRTGPLDRALRELDTLANIADRIGELDDTSDLSNAFAALFAYEYLHDRMFVPRPVSGPGMPSPGERRSLPNPLLSTTGRWQADVRQRLFDDAIADAKETANREWHALRVDVSAYGVAPEPDTLDRVIELVNERLDELVSTVETTLHTDTAATNDDDDVSWRDAVSAVTWARWEEQILQSPPPDAVVARDDDEVVNLPDDPDIDKPDLNDGPRPGRIDETNGIDDDPGDGPAFGSGPQR